MSRNSTRRFVGWTLVFALVAAALTAMIALATGSVDDTTWRVVGTALGFGVFSSIGSTGTDLLARKEGALRLLGVLTAVLAVAAYAVFLAAIWATDDSDTVWRWFGGLAFAFLAASHASMTLGARRPGDTRGIDALVFASVGLAALGAGIGIAGVAGLLDEIDNSSVRWLGVLLVALLLTSVLPPVLRRIGSERQEKLPVVEIKARHHGPYKVTGPIRLIDADGNEYDIPQGEPVALCRCGASKTKPFCDKSHSEIGFEAAERAVSESG